MYQSSGTSEQAMTLYREAADIFNALGDEERYGQTLLAMVDIYMKSGKINEARATYQVALESIKDLSIQQKVAKASIDLINRIFGGGLPPAEPAKPSLPESDSDTPSDPSQN